MMSMKFLATDNQFISDLSTDEQYFNCLVRLDIIQYAKIADTQLEFGKWIRTQPLDGF